MTTRQQRCKETHASQRTDFPRQPSRPVRGPQILGCHPVRRPALRLRAGRKPRRWISGARFEKQVQLAFDNLNAVLEAAGCTLRDVIDVTTFHTDPERQVETVMAVRERNIGAPPYPNWTAVGVNWLAGFDFEIKAIARIPLQS